MLHLVFDLSLTTLLIHYCTLCIDAIICDPIYYGCQVVAEYADIKIQVDVSPLGICEPISTAFLIPSPLAYVPQLDFTHQMSLYQRIINVMIYSVLYPAINYFLFNPLYTATKTSELDLQTIPRYENKRATFLIANGDFAIDYPRPVVPSSKVVGPILARPAKTLPSDLRHFVSSNSNGTILVSFGTVVTAMKHVVNMQVLYQAFSRLPYNVLWKYSEDFSTDSISNNVKIVKWLPQNDVLGNSNIKGFITHCGYNSILEAGYHGVPMVGTPVAGDQLIQASKITARNIGVVLDIRTMTSDDLYHAIIKITHDKDILANISQTSKLIRNRPNGRTPVEEAADWIEFALKCDGGDYLRTEEYNMKWYELYLLDVYAVIIVVCYLMYNILKLMWKGLTMLCCSKKKVKIS